jgi:hypothetical protein
MASTGLNRPFSDAPVTLPTTPAGSGVPDIFLSYNREDQARAKLFAEALKAAGFEVWWDVGLKTGEAYDEVTENALRTAKGADTFSVLQFRTVDLISKVASSFRRYSRPPRPVIRRL